MFSFFTGALNRREEVIDKEMEDMKEREKYIREMLPQVRARADKKLQMAIDYQSRYDIAEKQYKSSPAIAHMFARTPDMDPKELLNWTFTDKRQKDLATQTAANLTPPSLSQVGTTTQASVDPGAMQPNMTAQQPRPQMQGMPGQPAGMAPPGAPAWTTAPMNPGARASMVDVIFGRIPSDMKTNTIYQRLGADMGIDGSILQNQMAAYGTGQDLFTPPPLPEGEFSYKQLPYEVAAKAHTMMQGEEWTDPAAAYKLLSEGISENNDAKIQQAFDYAMTPEAKAAMQHRYANMPGEFNENQIDGRMDESIKRLLGGKEAGYDAFGKLQIRFGEDSQNDALLVSAKTTGNTLLEQYKPERKAITPADIGPFAMAGALQTINSSLSELSGNLQITKDANQKAVIERRISELKGYKANIESGLQATLGGSNERMKAILKAANIVASAPPPAAADPAAPAAGPVAGPVAADPDVVAKFEAAEQQGEAAFNALVQSDTQGYEAYKKSLSGK